MIRSARHHPQFDRAQLAMLGEALGRDGLRSTLSELPAEIAAIKQRIESALGRDDRDAAGRACLVLKGVASNFGAARLAAVCRAFSRGLARESSVTARLAELSETIDKTLVALELELGDALHKDEFELLYLPWLDAESGRIAGYEALARWRHPTRGLLAAMQFIPMAEESGMIEELSGWVLRRACSDAVGWPADMKLSINLSPEQYASDYLCGAVFDALDFTALAANRLELEIVDPLATGDLRKLKRNLEELNARGIGPVRRQPVVAERHQGTALPAHQDRQVAGRRDHHAPARRPDRCEPGRARAGDRACRDGGRCRDRGAGRTAARTGMHRDAGISVQPPAHGDRGACRHAGLKPFRSDRNGGSSFLS
ncbi:MAG TPA: EAL domain-containing protein [Bradyrhizobium sp.]|nr:EAL domain-containing protein [Bradyrhizobium sp.]